MDIIFQGNHSSQEAAESLMSIIRLFQERYGIENFREMELKMTLVDKQGDDVELVDNETAEIFRVFEIYKTNDHLVSKNTCPPIRLVIDNTRC